MFFSAVFFVVKSYFFISSVVYFVGFDLGDEKVNGFFLDSTDDSGVFLEFTVQVNQSGKFLELDFQRS